MYHLTSSLFVSAQSPWRGDLSVFSCPQVPLVPEVGAGTPVVTALTRLFLSSLIVFAYDRALLKVARCMNISALSASTSLNERPVYSRYTWSMDGFVTDILLTW